jgi:hypothetical protein
MQDWSTDASTPLGLRLVESFRINPELHAALPPTGRGRRFSPARRAFRAASAGPDWRVGAGAMSYLKHLGYNPRDFTAELSAGSQSGLQTVHAVAPGRYVPAFAYRRLGGGNLCELALNACGAHGITAQLQGGGQLERASLALAVAEAAIVHRMGLATEDKST